MTNPDKVGRDAGALCGTDPVGVAATDDLDEVLALAPDCVLYMQQGYDVDVLCALLGRGDQRGDHHRRVPPPRQHGPVVRDRIEAACATGGTSLHATGVSPGFISEAIPIVLTSIQRRLDRLHIAEFADLSSRDSPMLLFDLMGFGNDPSTFDPLRWTYGGEAFGPSLRQLGDALGMPIDSVESSGEVATAVRDVEIAAGTIPAGTVAGQRMNVVGYHGGAELLSLQRHLVLLDRDRRGVGPAPRRLARDRRGRLPARHGSATRHPARADGGDDPGIHGQPGGQRGGRRVRGGPGHPDHGRPATDRGRPRNGGRHG